MLELRPIKNGRQLDSFVEKSPFVHYMKTSMWAEFKNRTSKDNYEFLGFYDEDELIATAMVLKNSWMFHKYAYIPWGPCMDYHNESLVNEVFTLLKKYADENDVQFLRVDPNVIRCHREIDGSAIEDGYSMEFITDDLIKLNYRHKGYGYAYNGSWTNRYTLIADLSGSYEDIIAAYAKPRRTAINRHKITGVFTRIGTKDDIPSLMEFEKQLTEQDGFKPHSKFFFESLLDCFGEHAVLYVTEINFGTMINGIEEELSGKKYAKDPEARNAKEKELSKAKDFLNRYGKQIPIACGLFIRIGDMSWDLYTYNHKEFNFIKPVDSLHAFAMKDMKDHGVLRYDMCGFSGVTDKSDPYYGLYSYKRSFGPEFIEQIGEFDYVRNEGAMKRFAFEKRAVNHFKRKYLTKRYKKKTG